MASLGSRIRNATPIRILKPRSELETKLNEALGAQKWGCSNTLLNEIAMGISNAHDRAVVMANIWKILQEKDKEWRRVFKALALMEILLKQGSLEVAKDVEKDLWRVKRWTEHRIVEGGKDVASGIREKSRFIVELAEDASRLEAERIKNSAMMEKMQGISNPQHAPKQSARPAPLTPRSQGNHKHVQVGFHVITEAEMEAAAAVSDKSTTGNKPDFNELRWRCGVVQSSTGLNAQKAMQFLKEGQWDTGKAIFLSAQHKETDSTESGSDEESDSDSDSESSSDESDPGQHARQNARESAAATTKLGNGWPQQGGTTLTSRSAKAAGKGFPAGGDSAWGWPGNQAHGETLAGWQGGKGGDSSKSAAGWTVSPSGREALFQQSGKGGAASDFHSLEPYQQSGKGGAQGNPFASQQIGKGAAKGNPFGGNQAGLVRNSAGYSGQPVTVGGFVAGKDACANPFRDQSANAGGGVFAGSQQGTGQNRQSGQSYPGGGHQPAAGNPFGAGNFSGW